MQKGGVIDSLRSFDCAGVSTNRRGATQILTSAAGKAIRVQGVVQRVRNAARIGAEHKAVFVLDHDGRSLEIVERHALEVGIRRGGVLTDRAQSSAVLPKGGHLTTVTVGGVVCPLLCVAVGDSGHKRVSTLLHVAVNFVRF